uniref:CD74 molecule n=1 Tax=Sphenodon punctatus TaxID=8508 RepID=A0A8D0G9V9_SPHPU
MEDERRNLVASQELPTAEVAGTGRRGSCTRSAVFSALSILVALLIAGQAVTVYFVYQQSGQISKLTKTSQTLQLESLARTLPHTNKPTPKLRMAMFNMPLAMKELPSADMTEEMPKLSNKTEDQVKHVLLQANPSRSFPELKNNLMENLNDLKSKMNPRDWLAFESWLQKWLLFEMAKNSQAAEPTAVPEEEVQSKCQAEASVSGVYPGRYHPQCDEHGDYLPKQCLASTGFCWCVYKNGTKIEHTETREKMDCPAFDIDELLISGLDQLKVDSGKDFAK